jgi:hypothetical protein
MKEETKGQRLQRLLSSDIDLTGQTCKWQGRTYISVPALIE